MVNTSEPGEAAAKRKAQADDRDQYKTKMDSKKRATTHNNFDQQSGNDSQYQCSMQNQIIINNVDKVEKELEQQFKHIYSTLKPASIRVSQATRALLLAKNELEIRERDLETAKLEFKKLNKSFETLNEELCRIHDWKKVGGDMKLRDCSDSLSEEDA